MARYPGVQPWHLAAAMLFAIGFSVVYAGTLVGREDEPPRRVESLTSEDIDGLRDLVEVVGNQHLTPAERRIIDRVDHVLEGIENGDVSIAPETTTTTIAAPAPVTTTPPVTTTTTATSTPPPPTTTTAPRPRPTLDDLLDMVGGQIQDDLSDRPDALP